MLGRRSGTRLDPRRLLHVGFRSRTESRVQLATLVYIDREIGFRLDFFEHFLNCVLGKLELDRCHIYLSILNCPHNWPKTAIFDAWHWFDDTQVFTGIYIFGNG